MKQTLRQCGPRFSIPCESIATLVPKNNRGHYVCQFGEARVRSCGKEQRSLILFLLRDCTTTVAVYVYGNQSEIKGPREVNTQAIIGKEKKNPQKNKAPDSQTSQATCQTEEIDRAHRSHSTREAKQNKTKKRNQGSPIKKIKPHDSILVPLLGRGVFTAGFAPASTNDFVVLHPLDIFSFSF